MSSTCFEEMLINLSCWKHSG